MCTAITYKTKDAYFGRTLDIECSYGEEVIVTPRNFALSFRHTKGRGSHCAIVGMGTVREGYPLYYDAANEYGLGMAGLNFPTNACYFPLQEGKENVTPFEFIPWILGQCITVDEAKQLLANINLVKVNFSEQLPLSPLHWMISDKERSIVVESLESGMQVHDNPFEVLTNNPTFDYHRINMSNYMGLNVGPANTQFKEDLPLNNYSLGMGAIGLPGDLSSASRFVKVAFTKMNSLSGDSESESISQFFHILGSVDQQRGCVRMGEGQYEITIYTSCCNTDKGIYY